MRLKKSPLPISWHNTIHQTQKITTNNYVDITEYVYLFQFLSFHSVSYDLVEKAFANLRHCRSVWGSLLNTYPQSSLYLTCCRRMISKDTVLKKDGFCRGNFYCNGFLLDCEFTTRMSMHMPMCFVYFV